MQGPSYIVLAMVAALVGCTAPDRNFGASESSGSSSGGSAGGAGGGGTAEPSGAGVPAVARDALFLWLAANRGVTEQDGSVSRWKDQSGHGADATQGVATARPALVMDPGAKLPMLHFDGENDALELPAGSGDFSQGLSFFAVVRLEGDVKCPQIACFANEPEVDDVCFGLNDGTPAYEVSDPSIHGATGTFPAMQTVLLSVVHTPPDQAEIRLNGSFVQGGKLPLPKNVTRRINFLGRTLYGDCTLWKGMIAEIALYRRAIADAGRIEVEQYLKKKWGCCG